MNNIYVLLLKGGYYYVGKTANISDRIVAHVNGEGSLWTKLHPVKTLQKVYIEESIFDEDKITLEYMSTYGIEKVRGGTFSSVTLSSDCVNVIESMICHAKNLCFKCRGEGHFASMCTVNDKVCEDKNIICCEMCFRIGHTANECVCTHTISGDKI